MTYSLKTQGYRIFQNVIMLHYQGNSGDKMIENETHVVFITISIESQF